MKKKDVFHLEIKQRQQQQQQQFQSQTTLQSYLPHESPSVKHLISPSFSVQKSLNILKASPLNGITPKDLSFKCTDSIFPRKRNLGIQNDVKFQIPLFPLSKRSSDNLSVGSSPQLSFRNQTSSLFHPQNSCRINSPEKQQQQIIPQRSNNTNCLIKRLIFPPCKNENGLSSLPSDISANRNYSIRFSEAMTANKVKKKIIAQMLQQDKGSIFETTGSSSIASISPKKQQGLFNSSRNIFFRDIFNNNNLRKTAMNSVHEQGEMKWRNTGYQSLHRNTLDEKEKEEERKIFVDMFAQQKNQSKEGGVGQGMQGVAKISQAYQLIKKNTLDENEKQIKQQFNMENDSQQKSDADNMLNNTIEKNTKINQKVYQVVDATDIKGQSEINENLKQNTVVINTQTKNISPRISLNSTRKHNNISQNSKAVKIQQQQSSNVKTKKSTSLYFNAAGQKKTQNVIQQTTFIETVEEAFAREFMEIQWDQNEESQRVNDSRNLIAIQQTAADSQQTAESIEKRRVGIGSQQQRENGSKQILLDYEKHNNQKDKVISNREIEGLDGIRNEGNAKKEENYDGEVIEEVELGTTQEKLHLNNSDNDAAYSLMTPMVSESNIEGSYSNAEEHIQQRTYSYEEPAIFDLIISVFTTKEQFLQKLNKKVNNIFQQYLLSQQQGQFNVLNANRLAKKIAFTVESLDVLQIIKENNNISLFELLKTYLKSGLLQTAQEIVQEMQFSPRLTGFSQFNSQVKLRSPRFQNTGIKCNIIVISKPRRNFKDSVFSTPQKTIKQQGF